MCRRAGPTTCCERCDSSRRPDRPQSSLWSKVQVRLRRLRIESAVVRGSVAWRVPVAGTRRASAPSQSPFPTWPQVPAQTIVQGISEKWEAQHAPSEVPSHPPPGFPYIFLNHFPYFFNTKLKKFNVITSLDFSKFFIMKLHFSHCITLHKCCFQWNSAHTLLTSFPFRISILFQNLIHILAKFKYKVLKINFEIQCFFHSFNTAWEPCSPEFSSPEFKRVKQIRLNATWSTNS